MPRSRLLATRAISVFGVGVGIALVASLTGCSALASATAQHRQVFYSTLASASAAAVAKVPEFVPRDATQVTIRSLPGHGQTMQFASATPLTPQLCHDGTLSGRPRINSNWWPTTAPPTTGMICDSGWQLFTLDGVTYGWTAEEFSR